MFYTYVLMDSLGITIMGRCVILKKSGDVLHCSKSRRLIKTIRWFIIKLIAPIGHSMLL